MSGIVVDSSGRPYETPSPGGVELEALERRVELALASVQELISRSLNERQREHDLDIDTREKLLAAARFAYFTNPIARQIVESYVDLILGHGLPAIGEDDAANEVIADFDERNRMADRKPDIVRRVLRDGELFIRKYRTERGLLLRCYPSEFCRRDTYETHPEEQVPNLLRERAEWDSGVITDKEDIERVRGYLFDGLAAPLMPHEVEHVRINADFDMLHGRTILEAVLKRLGQYEGWVDQRVVINRLKTAVYLIKRIKGRLDGAQAVSQLANSVIRSTRPGEENAAKIPATGTVLIATDNIDYEFVQAEIDAKDVAEDGRRMLLDIGAGTCLPEYVFGDAANQNKASSQTAESPTVKRIQRLRTSPFGSAFERLYCEELRLAMKRRRLSKTVKRWVMKPAAKAALIAAQQEQRDAAGDGRRDKKARSIINSLVSAPESYELRETPRTCRVQLMWPEIVPREVDKLVAAYAKLEERNVVSKSTLAAKVGENYDTEQDRMALERQPDFDGIDPKDIAEGQALFSALVARLETEEAPEEPEVPEPEEGRDAA